MNNVSNMSLTEVMQTLNERYGTSFILPLEDDKPKFTPERLLGVETNRGHITLTEQGIVVCEGSGGWYAETLKYYISDDSDETVPLDEYIKLFYNTENTL